MDLVFFYQNSMEKMIDFEWIEYNQNKQIAHDSISFDMYLIVLKFEDYSSS